MSFDVDEDILQDFLIEASEILEQLSEQLVELENNPNDSDLLNAIFRGFHTVKGGAGFLSLTELVETCHGAENVFDTLRNGGRKVGSDLMDVILEAFDTINEQFASVQTREEMSPASPELIEKLKKLSKPASESEIETDSAETEVIAPEIKEEKEIVDNSKSSENTNPTDNNSNEDIDNITEEEFEALLDELEASGNDPKKPKNNTVKTDNFATSEDDEITEEEFEALLNELHGSSGFNSTLSAQNQADESINKSNQQEEPKKETEDQDLTQMLNDLSGSKNNTQKSNTTQETPKKQDQPKQQAKAVQKPETAKKAPAKSPHPQTESTVRVDTRTLDEIMNMVGELVLVRNRLVSLGAEIQDEVMSKTVSNLDVVTADLQGAVMKTRMQPIKKVFGRFPRLVRDLARSLKKDISLVLEGEETDLDKNLVEALADPLIHLVRNSVDHGIEMPDVREERGKDRQGTIILSASQEGDHILLTINDDGNGMDPEKLKSIAMEKGILDPDAAAKMPDKDAFNLIFAPGFSTKKEISDISGRGVGMDVVKTGITQLNGLIDIDSELGKGSVIKIKVPLTLAILPTLMVGVGNQIFAFPLTSVNEIFHLNLNKTNLIDGQETVIVREKAIPLFYLEKWLLSPRDRKNNSNKESEGQVVIVQIGVQQVGFVVDSLIGQEEVVIKPLDELLQGTAGMSGATITSDGRIALILDIPTLLKHYAGRA